MENKKKTQRKKSTSNSKIKKLEELNKKLEEEKKNLDLENQKLTEENKNLDEENKRVVEQNRNYTNKLFSASKKYNRIKKQRRFLIVLILLLLLSGGIAAGFFFNKYKTRIIRIIKYRSTSEVKNEKIDKFHTDDEFVENYHNANYSLKLKNAYGNNDATHPKVLNFKEKWNGYKYWMVYSPYPHSDDSKENPHIKVSNDLINWNNPDNFENPLDDAPEDYENMVVYYSDPHLVYNDDKDELECYYRRVDDKKDEMVLYRKTTKDGVNWTDKEVVLKTKRSKHDYVSPAIIYDKGIYKIWYVDKGNTTCYAESEDGYHYSECKKIDLKYPVSVKTWHLDVIKTEKGYEMITVAYINWNDRATMNLYHFKSDNETDFKDGKIIIKPSLVSWDNSGLYRSTFIYENDTYYVFYSGISQARDRGIGLSYGKHIENLIGSNIKTQENVLDDNEE